jgi:hypothetical protein
MESKVFDFKVGSAYGEELKTALDATATYTHYESYEEVDQAGKLPSKKEIVGFVNAKNKAAARAAATTAALEKAGYQKPTLEQPQVQLKTMIKVLVAAGRSEDNARQIAETTLGVKLEE